MPELEAGSGRWQRVVNPSQSYLNERVHTCQLPQLDLSIGNGSTWGCVCGRQYRVNRRGNEMAWVSGHALPDAAPPVIAPHVCSLPPLTPDLAVGNDSTWVCACGKVYRVNRRGDSLSWVNG